MLHPEKNQNKIAEIADVDDRHVHTVVYSLPKDQYNNYQADVIQESDITVTPEDPQADEEDMVTVAAPMEIMVEISLPRKDVERASIAAMRAAVTEPLSKPD